MPSALPFEPAEFLPRFAAVARAAGFGAESFGEVHGSPLHAYTKRTAGSRPRVYLSAGIHGDELAPPQALLRLVERGFFDGRCVWFLCPLLNPTGFARGARENHEGIDLNRDYRHLRSAEVRAHVAWLGRQPLFDLTLCLHEDWEAKGFYVYEINPDGQPSLAGPMVDAVAEDFPIDLSAEIDGRPANGGIIRPNIDPAQRELWPEAIYLHAHHTRLGYTLETASSLPLEARITAHCLAVETALEVLLRPPHP